MILTLGHDINGYKVATFIKEGPYNETYRVIGNDGKSYFLKIYDTSRMPYFLMKDGAVTEVAAYSRIKDILPDYMAQSGTIEIGGKQYPYLTSNFFGGELLSSRSEYTTDNAVRIAIKALKSLSLLHKGGMLHNDLTLRNIMVEDIADGTDCDVHLIDFGHVTDIDKPMNIYTADLEPFFRAPDSFYGRFSPQSDIFSMGAVLYGMLFGRLPWEGEIEGNADEKTVKTVLHTLRKGRLSFDGLAEGDWWLIEVITRALALKPEERYASADDFIHSLEEREAGARKKDVPADDRVKNREPQTQEKGASFTQEAEVRKGNGFADVAGMDELKSLLHQKVIFLLKNRERAKKYRLTPPNGMLLYGPPGCGKTFFAEKFAEESGFNFHFVKASDLGSIYVHGTQGKIAELFDKAARTAPTIICFDEFDAMVPSRQNNNNNGAQSGEVNEFLSQLNNCSQRGIFVIGTTNQPDLIDGAVLRKGRLDLAFYIPEPDENTRKLMFDINLKDRPCLDVDTAKLARMTTNYVGSDISYIVNDAAMMAAFRDLPITQDDLENSIACTRPSLNERTLAYYRDLMARFSGDSSRGGNRPRVGFAFAD